MNIVYALVKQYYVPGSNILCHDVKAVYEDATAALEAAKNTQAHEPSETWPDRLRIWTVIPVEYFRSKAK